MKRLFCVKDSKGKNAVHMANQQYFDNKQVAKAFRDSLEGSHHVSRGPDHIGKHSGYGVPRMRRQPKV